MAPICPLNILQQPSRPPSLVNLALNQNGTALKANHQFGQVVDNTTFTQTVLSFRKTVMLGL